MQKLLGTYKGFLTEESLRRAGFEVDSKFYDKGFTNQDLEIVEFEYLNKYIDLKISDDKGFDFMDSKGIYYKAHWFESIEEPVSSDTIIFTTIIFTAFIAAMVIIFNLGRN